MASVGRAGWWPDFSVLDGAGRSLGRVHAAPRFCRLRTGRLPDSRAGEIEAAPDSQETGIQQVTDGETVTLTPEQLEHMLTAAADKAVERIEAKRRQSRPSGGRPPARAKPGGMRVFNPETREEVDATQKAWLWRRDVIDVCPCGQERYARTMEFQGSQNIDEAQYPVMSGDRVVQLAWEHVESMPEDLQRTEAKAEHFRACNEAHIEVVPISADAIGQAGKITNVA